MAVEFIVEKDYEAMSARAADVIATCLKADPACTLGLATGTTPIGLYGKLVEMCNAKEITFAEATTFNLDEYRGLPGTHDQSYRYFMNKYLFDLVDIDKAKTHVPDGSNPDADAACAEYEQMIAEAGGVDLQLLGLGHNGHIGFNEPCDNFPVNTHVVQLTQRTIEANSRLFDSIDDVPREAYTMGIGTIMRARMVLLVASGVDKAETVRDAFFGPVVPTCPASALQLHPNAIVIVDEAAASLCPAANK